MTFVITAGAACFGDAPRADAGSIEDAGDPALLTFELMTCQGEDAYVDAPTVCAGSLENVGTDELVLVSASFEGPDAAMFTQRLVDDSTPIDARTLLAPEERPIDVVVTPTRGGPVAATFVVTTNAGSFYLPLAVRGVPHPRAVAALVAINGAPPPPAPFLPRLYFGDVLTVSGAASLPSLDANAITAWTWAAENDSAGLELVIGAPSAAETTVTLQQTLPTFREGHAALQLEVEDDLGFRSVALLSPSSTLPLSATVVDNLFIKLTWTCPSCLFAAHLQRDAADLSERDGGVFSDAGPPPSFSRWCSENDCHPANCTPQGTVLGTLHLDWDDDPSLSPGDPVTPWGTYATEGLQWLIVPAPADDTYRLGVALMGDGSPAPLNAVVSIELLTEGALLATYERTFSQTGVLLEVADLAVVDGQVSALPREHAHPGLPCVHVD